LGILFGSVSTPIFNFGATFFFFKIINKIPKYRVEPGFSEYFFFSFENLLVCAQIKNLSAYKPKQYAQKISKSSPDRAKIDSENKITFFNSCSKPFAVAG